MRDYEYEPRVIVKKKGGFLGKFVAFILGIVVGIVGGFGGVAYAGYYIVTKVKIEDAVNTVNGFAGLGIDYTQYISESYGQKTVYDLVGDAYQAVMNIAQNSGTLQDLDDISPLVYELIAGKDADSGEDSEIPFNLVDFLKGYGVELDADKMMSLIVVKPAAGEGEEATADPDTYLMDYIMDCVNKMPVGDILVKLGYEMNPILNAICYGADGNTPLTLEGFIGADLMQQMYSLPVDLFLENISTDDGLIMTLAYGPSYRYTVNGSNVDMNPVFYTYNVAETTLYDGDGNNVTDTIVQDSLNIDLSIPIATCQLTVGEETWYLQADTSESTEEVVKFYAYTDDTYATVIKYKETTVGELSNISDTLLANLTIGDVVENTSGNKILEALADTKIKDVPAKLDSLTIGDLIDVSGNKILQALSNSTLSSLKDDINNVELTAVIEPDTENSIIMYLLYGKEGVHYQVETDGTTITPLQKRVKVDGTTVYNEYGEEITGAVADTANFTYTLNEITYTLTDASTTLGAGWYYVSKDGEAVKYEPTTLGDLQGENASLLSNLTSRLTVGDVMGDVSDNKILCHLADITISGLSDAIHSLRIKDVFEKDMYITDINGNFLDANGNITTNPDEYVMKHTWEYMLKDPTTGKLHHEYTLEDNMGDLMTNFTKNVQVKSLETLINDGIIEFDGETEEEKTTKKNNFMNAYYTVVVTDENGVPTTKNVYLHDMTIPQLLDFIVENISKFNTTNV